MSPHAYTEDQLVEQPAIGLFAALGWQTVSALDETFGPDWRFRRYGPANTANVLTLGWLGMGTSATRAGNVWTLNLSDNSPGDLRREAGRILFIGGPVRSASLFANGFE